jgi:N4-(beta-N-acetylglucosaminyl)-L-asparaginase
MSTRRKFLETTFLGSAFVIANKSAIAAPLTETILVYNSPIVISTWDFGQKANVGAWEVLSKGGRALDAVEQGVKIPEADPNIQTIGYGGLPDRDGHVTLDAAIMDESYNCGSVMCLENIVHAISVARLVMEKTPHIILAGDGALQFALANGFKKENLLTEKSKKDWEDWLKTSKYNPEINIENRLYDKKTDPMPGGQSNHDTIGMLAMDTFGNLSGACTTSGLAYKMHGRVGDSPVIGAGLYVANEVGAASATGVGEEVIRIAGSHLVVEFMRQGMRPEKACKKAIERIVQINPEKSKNIQVAFIALNKRGDVGGYSLQPGFFYSVRSNKLDKIFPAQSHYTIST